MEYDLIVIGGGPGGYTAAIQAAKYGMRTALVEQDRLGGTCLNRGCIPTKAMLHAAELYRSIEESARFGIDVSGTTVSYPALLSYRDSTVNRLVEGVEELLRANGVEYISGHGVLLPDRRVQVGEDIVQAANVLLAAGSVPKLLPIPGIELEGVVTSDGLFEMKACPRSMTVIGAGAVGVEMAQAFSGLGTRVALIEAQPQLLPGMDRDVSQNLRMILRKRGVDVHTGASISGISREAGELVCRFTEREREEAAAAEIVLCAVGRRPNLKGLFDPRAMPRLEKGFVAVNEGFETNIAGVYAIGDLIGGDLLAHTAFAQGKAVARRIAGRATDTVLTVVPKCVYTSPEIAAVGLTQQEAAKQGVPVRVVRRPMGANGRTVIAQDERSFVKIVVSEPDGTMLGAQLMCARATDMIGELTGAVVHRMTVRQMLQVMRAHPTYDECVGEALEELAGDEMAQER